MRMAKRGLVAAWLRTATGRFFILLANVCVSVMDSTTTSSDAAFQRQLAAARRGDREAFGELFQEQWDALWNLAAGQLEQSLQGKQAPSDVVQETFLAAHRSITDFRGSTPAEFQAWLRMIVQNHVCDAWRHFMKCQKRDATREVRMLGFACDEDLFGLAGTSPSESLLAQERRLNVASTLNQLPEHYRTILHMRYWEQRTFEDMGQALGKSSDAVRQLWYRAVEHFSRLIDDRNI